LSLQSTPFSSKQHAYPDLEIAFSMQLVSEGHLVGTVAFVEHLIESSFKSVNKGFVKFVPSDKLYPLLTQSFLSLRISANLAAICFPSRIDPAKP